MTSSERARRAVTIATLNRSNCRGCWGRSKRSCNERRPDRKRAMTKRPLAKIRHDLRTPINHIIGFSEMLIEDARGQAPENFVRDVERIAAGGGRLLALINQHFSEEAFPAAKP